jgi:glycolate oxidase FAD binding subunit
VQSFVKFHPCTSQIRWQSCFAAIGADSAVSLPDADVFVAGTENARRRGSGAGFRGGGAKLFGVENLNLLTELQALVGAANVRADAALPDAVASAGWEAAPAAIVAPGTAAEVAAVVQAAEGAQAAVIPFGGGTQLHTGYPPRAEKPLLLLSTACLNRILDYQPDDLTVTCEPGVTLAALQATLADRRQMLALDVPLSERATLGGIVSANASGFWRPAYGTPRDLLIGLRAVMSGGAEVRGGGKVVKNVAGYDVCKLFTGAWGTLGVLTELTFKVRTRPAVERALAWNVPDVAIAARIGLALYHARLAPTYLLATNEPDGRPRLILGLQGTPSRVEWQAVEFARRAEEARLNALPVTLTEAEVDALRDAQARLGPETPLAARIACLPTDLAGLTAELEGAFRFRLTAHCGTGILSLATDTATLAVVSQVQAALPAGANLVWTRLDGDFAASENIAVWGEIREDSRLQHALKQSLDPRGTFSPGRFPGKTGPPFLRPDAAT